MDSRSLALGALLAAGCAPGAAVLAAGAEIRAVLLLERSEGSEPSLRALAIDGAPARVELEGAGADGVLTALLYQADLVSLGVPAGAIGQGGGRALPAEDRVIEAARSGRSIGEWLALPERPAIFDRFSLPRTATRAEGCGAIDRITALVTSTVPTQLVVPDSSVGAVIGSADGTLHRVSRLGALPLDPSLKAPFVQGRAQQDGTLRLATRDGSIYLATPAGGSALDLSLETRVDLGGELIDFDVPFELGAPRELFALAASGRIDRFDGSTWAELRPGDPQLGLRKIRRDGPERVIASGPGGVVIVAHGEARVVPPPEGAVLAAFGPATGDRWVGAAGTRFLELDLEAAAWRPLGDPLPVGVEPIAVTWSGLGFDYGTRDGRLGRFVYPATLCPPASLTDGPMKLVDTGLDFQTFAVEDRPPGEVATVFEVAWRP